KICHQVAVMENGSIVEQGDVLDVFHRPQQAVTKKFVEQIMGLTDDEDEVEPILATYNQGKMIRLHFLGETTNQALISQLSKQFAIEINIVQGKITHTKRGAYGTLFVQMLGEQAEM